MTDKHEFTVPVRTSWNADEIPTPVKIEVVQHDDNLFFYLNGETTGVSVWFHGIPVDDDSEPERLGKVIITMGRHEEEFGGWEPDNDYAYEYQAD
jgi:hypothetical protein